MNKYEHNTSIERMRVKLIVQKKKNEEKNHMSNVHYAYAIDNLIYASCTAG